MDIHRWLSSQFGIYSMGDKSDRVTCTRQIRRQGIVRPIHAAGQDKIRSDQHERTAGQCGSSAKTKTSGSEYMAAANNAPLSIK